MARTIGMFDVKLTYASLEDCHSELEPFDKLRINSAEAKNLGGVFAAVRFFGLRPQNDSPSKLL
jgi:hypothetical protein